MRGALDLFDAAPIGSPRAYYDQYDLTHAKRAIWRSGAMPQR
jgi:hypothetical protein